MADVEELRVPVNRLEYGLTLWVRRSDVSLLADAGFYFEVVEHDTWGEAEEEGRDSTRYSRVRLTGHGDDPVDAQDDVDDVEPEDFEPYVCEDCGREFGPDEYDTKKSAAGARAGHGQAHRAEQAHEGEGPNGGNPPGRADASGMTAGPEDADDEQTGLDALYQDDEDGPEGAEEAVEEEASAE